MTDLKETHFGAMRELRDELRPVLRSIEAVRQFCDDIADYLLLAWNATHDDRGIEVVQPHLDKLNAMLPTLHRLKAALAEAKEQPSEG